MERNSSNLRRTLKGGLAIAASVGCIYYAVEEAKKDSSFSQPRSVSLAFYAGISLPLYAAYQGSMAIINCRRRKEGTLEQVLDDVDNSQ